MEKVCPVAKIIGVLGKKWNLLILRQLNDNSKKRFNELSRDIGGISSRTLSKRLVELEKAKLVKRQRFNEIPPRVEYSLTESGRHLIRCFAYLNDWVERYG